MIKIKKARISECKGTSTFQYIGQLIIAVKVTTKIIAMPIPMAVL